MFVRNTLYTTTLLIYSILRNVECAYIYQSILSYRIPGIRALCYYYYPPCGNITHFESPKAVCHDVCYDIITTVCKEEWLQTFIDGLKDAFEFYQLHFLNCSNPGAPLHPLPHCCSDAGVIIDSG